MCVVQQGTSVKLPRHWDGRLVNWNHHQFERGKRKDKSPMALADMADVPSLSQFFDRLLGRGQATSIPI